MSFFRKPTPLPVTQGGTGNVFNTYGYAIIGNGYSAYLELTPSTSGNVMTSNGTTWTSAPPASSGSGTVNSGTAYQLAYYAASGTAVSTLGSLGTNGQVLTSGGAGVAPTWTTISAGSAATQTTLGTVYGKMDTAGDLAVVLGYQAGASGGTLANTVAIGYQALFNQGGSDNVAVGTTALRQCVGGYHNVAVGYSAGYYVTSGLYNVAISGYALNGQGISVTGNNNIAIGFEALTNTNSGTGNVGIGHQALRANTNSNNLTAVGNLAGYQATGSSNTCIGADTGASLTSGTINTFIGRYAGQVTSTGNYNVHMGYGTSASSSSVNGEIVFVSGAAGATGKGASTGFITPNGGGVYQGNNSATWSVTSDQRLKKNIVDNTIGLEQINGIRVRNFEYRLPEEVDSELKETDAIKKEGVQLGVIAQELQQILPDCVKEETTGVLSVNSDNIMWHMINAIKELNAEIIALKAKVGI